MTESSGFFAELKRRHVVRAAVGHVVFFWLLVQLADVTAPYIGISDEAVRWTLLAGVALFPVTLVVAWFIEHPWHDKPGSRLLGDLVLIGAIAAIAALWVVDNLPDSARARTSLVILPFTHGEDAREEGLARALVADVNSLLMKSNSIDVIGMETALSPRLEGVGTTAVAIQLKVQNVLTGSVTVNGDEFTVHLQLSNADGEIIWDQRIGDSNERLFEVQEEIATEIQARLGEDGEDTRSIAQVAAQRCWKPSDTDALARYYEARNYMELRSDSEESRQQFREMIRIYEGLVDEYPNFSEAKSGLLWALMRTAQWHPDDALPQPERQQRVVALARAAVESCPTNGEALWLLPNEYDHENDWIGTWQQLTAFSQMDPDKPEHRQDLIFHYRLTGLTDKAIEVAEKNYAMNPYSPRGIRLLVGLYHYEGRLDEAVALEKELDALGHTGNRFASQDKAAQECADDDMDCFAKHLPPPFKPFEAQLRIVHRKPANEDEAAESVAAGMALFNDVPWMLNWLNGASCQNDHLQPLFYELAEAVLFGDEAMQQTLQQNRVDWYWPNMWMPACDDVWADPRFPDLVERLGFVEYWRTVGWGRACRETADGFECGTAQNAE